MGIISTSLTQPSSGWATPLLGPAVSYDSRPAMLAARLKHCMPLLNYAQRGHREQAFRHRSKTGRVGDLHITIGHTSPFGATIGEQRGFATLNLCLRGTGTVTTDSETYRLDQSSPLVFTPGEEHCCAMDHYLGLVIRVPQPLLLSTTMAMAGIDHRRADPMREAFSRPQDLDGRDTRTARLLKALCTSLELLSFPDGLRAGELSFLALDDHIVRLLVLLLCPPIEIPGGTSLSRFDEPYAMRALDQLLEWIRANLDRPISLSELERRSGYSRRSLQLLFRRHHNCTPTEWVRNQRLDAIHRRLLHPEQGDSVGNLAFDHGFPNPSSFTRLFRKRFGLLPSELLRQSRGHR
jgi:AraC-like DNA-binding protein